MNLVGLFTMNLFLMAAPVTLRSRAIALTLRAGLHSQPLILFTELHPEARTGELLCNLEQTGFLLRGIIHPLNGGQ